MKRRDFLKRVGIGSIGVVVVPTILASTEWDYASCFVNPKLRRAGWSFPMAKPNMHDIKWVGFDTPNYLGNHNLIKPSQMWCTVQQAIQRELFENNMELTQFLNIGRNEKT